MSAKNGRHFDPRLDAWLDQSLDAGQRAEFEALLARDEALRTEIRRQEAIDARLESLFAPISAKKVLRAVAAKPLTPELLALAQPPESEWSEPEADAATAADPVTTTVRPSAGRGGGGRILRWSPAARAAMVGLAAAVAGLGSYGIYVLSGGGFGGADELKALPYVPPAGAMLADYRQRVGAGFTPTIQCDNEQQFAGGVWQRFDVPLLLASALPSNVKALGFASSRSLSASTLMLLVKVDDQPVAVFIDRLSRDRVPELCDAPELKSHRRVLDPFVMYEISTFDTPKVLDHLYIPTDKSEDWLRKGAGGW